MGSQSLTANEFIDAYGDTIAMLIGISLMSGFLIMLIIDKLIFQSFHAHHHGHSHSTGEEIDLELINGQKDPGSGKRNGHRKTFELLECEVEEHESLLK